MLSSLELNSRKPLWRIANNIFNYFIRFVVRKHYKRIIVSPSIYEKYVQTTFITHEMFATE